MRCIKMKYVKTIDLWQGQNEQLIRSGHLRLQPGQWVKCGPEGVKSRYVGVFGLSVRVAHGCTTKQVTERFRSHIKAIKQAEKRAIKNV